MEATGPSSSCSIDTSPATVRRLTPSRAANSSAEVARVDSSAFRIWAALLTSAPLLGYSSGIGGRQAWPEPLLPKKVSHGTATG